MDDMIIGVMCGFMLVAGLKIGEAKERRRIAPSSSIGGKIIWAAAWMIAAAVLKFTLL